MTDGSQQHDIKRQAERATNLRAAKKPSTAQIRVLARMIQHGATIRVSTWVVEVIGPGRTHNKVPHRSYNAMRVAGWIEPDATPYTWRVSDAGRKAAE